MLLFYLALYSFIQYFLFIYVSFYLFMYRNKIGLYSKYAHLYTFA